MIKPVALALLALAAGAIGTGTEEESNQQVRRRELVDTYSNSGSGDGGGCGSCGCNVPCGGGGVILGACFSEFATVNVLGKGPVAMKDLQVGEKVLTGWANDNNSYETVYAFGHRNTDRTKDFLVIRTNQGSSLEMTGEHLVYIHGKSKPVPANSIKEGDILYGNGEEHIVNQIDLVERKGLYAPLTSSGKLLVDGIQTSAYIALQDNASTAYFELDEKHNALAYHDVAHMALSPFRMVCTSSFASSPLNLCEVYDDDGMPPYVAFTLRLAAWFDSFNNPAMRLVLLGAFTIFIAPFMALEFALMWTPSLAVFGAISSLLLTYLNVTVYVRSNKVKKV